MSSIKPVRSFIAVVSMYIRGQPPPRPRIQQLSDWSPTHLVSTDKRAELAFVDAGFPSVSRGVSLGKELTLVVGDDAEEEATRGGSCMAGAVRIEWDSVENSVRVISSIIGLPSVYVYRMPGLVALASDIRLFRAIAGQSIVVNPQAATELFTVGYPLEHRTLFEGITLMPGGHSFQVNSLGLNDLTSIWRVPEQQPDLPLSSYIDLQVAALREAVSRLQLSDSVFSLTGGLDTRAILATLLERDIKLTACTLDGGRNRSLDVRQARDLCRAYGMSHVVVSLDGQFLKDLPAYVMEASRLSGGHSSLGQAHEVFFHRQLKGLGSRRLSGIFGNQVGRQGVEGVSERNGSLSVLAEALRIARNKDQKQHWLTLATRRSRLQSQIQQENLFSSVGNYSIGNYFMTQQHPYASRELIENAFKGTFFRGECKAFSPLRARLRDLRHRFFGQPIAKSFQRTLVVATAGVVADYPINWGWRARGGNSLGGLARGGVAFADAASSRWCSRSSLTRKTLRTLRVEGVQEIKPWQEWLDLPLREFVNDSLRSRLVTESELFNAATVVRCLDEHYGGVKPHYNTLLATLDLALAQQVFADSPR